MRKTLAKGGQQGFTLIELVVVIVILGILAATALPRFANLQQNSRVAAMNGMLGAVNSSIAISHAQALVSSQTGATGTVTMDGGVTVALAFGYPTSAAAGIGGAVTTSGFTPTYTATTTTFDFSPSVANCNVVYTAATSASAPATAAATTTGC